MDATELEPLGLRVGTVARLRASKEIASEDRIQKIGDGIETENVKACRNREMAGSVETEHGKGIIETEKWQEGGGGGNDTGNPED